MQIDVFDKILSLDLSNCYMQLLKFPRSLPLLTTLYAQNNQFQDVFDCSVQLADLPKIRLLNISHNRIQLIKKLPPHLTHLYADGMQIEIEKSPNLQFLSFVQPNSVIDMRQLQLNFPKLSQLMIHESAKLVNGDQASVIVTRQRDIVNVTIGVDDKKNSKRDVTMEYLKGKLQDILNE
ncbi:Leucine-rich_repeat domain superfamily [Hexamita inflata]|uniref:Leucine-rich_repeat domain superfamily n=1 Tax=Hexamita inflata TaxID=28002 RepID=A0ABP1HEA6_9EUKA